MFKPTSRACPPICILELVDVAGTPSKSCASWDRRVDGRPGSALYEAFEEALWRRTFADEMPRRSLRSFLSLCGQRAVCRASRRSSPTRILRGSTIARRRTLHETRDDIVAPGRGRCPWRRFAVAVWRPVGLAVGRDPCGHVFARPCREVGGCWTGFSAAGLCLLRATA